MFLEFDFRGVPYIKIQQFWFLIFATAGMVGTLGALGVHQMNKSCIIAKSTGARFQEGLFNQKFLKFQNFGPPASPAFRPHFLRPWAENQNSAPNI